MNEDFVKKLAEAVLANTSGKWQQLPPEELDKDMPDYSLTILDLVTNEVYAFACWELEGNVLKWMAEQIRTMQTHTGHSSMLAYLLRK